MMRVGFLGSGKMAQALARGILTADVTKPEFIVASSPKADAELLEQMAKMGCTTTYFNSVAVQQSQVVVMAVKPPVAANLLKEISPYFTGQHLLLSVTMGTTIKTIESILPPKSRVIRVMPNTPALIRQGASVFSCGSSVSEEDAETAQRIFSSVGICEQVDESLLDAVTGLSGSGPAYMFIAIEALADGAVKMGIPRALAINLAAQTMMGSAKMVLETGRHPGSLKDDVCSPGGTTIHAVHQLEKGHFRSILMDAVKAATLKSKETGKT